MDLTTSRHIAAAFTGTVVTLLSSIYAAFSPQVYVNGVLQRETAHYVVSVGALGVGVITFTGTVTNADVVVIYVEGS